MKERGKGRKKKRRTFLCSSLFFFLEQETFFRLSFSAVKVGGKGRRSTAFDGSELPPPPFVHIRYGSFSKKMGEGGIEQRMSLKFVRNTFYGIRYLCRGFYRANAQDVPADLFT